MLGVSLTIKGLLLSHAGMHIELQIADRIVDALRIHLACYWLGRPTGARTAGMSFNER